MSKASPVILKTNPHRPVDFKESSVKKALEASGNLNLEVKEDGCQVNIVVYYETIRELGKGWQVLFLSREGKEFNGLKELGAKLSRDERWLKVFNEHLEAGLFADRDGFMLQAEVLTLDDEGDYKPCAEIAGDLRRMEPIPLERLRFVAFDLIPFDVVRSGEEYEVFQEVRLGHMMHQVMAITNRFPELDIRPVTFKQVFSVGHLMCIYEDFRANGKEGGVAKDPLGYWKRGKKTGQWKVKPSDECDGTVVRPMWGTPGLSNEGFVIGFTVLTEHGVEVDAGGITEDQKVEFTANVMKNPDHYKDWAVQITYMERLPSGSYRHPNFSHFRGITGPFTKE